MLERLLTVREVANWLGVSKAWIYDHTTRKRPFLPCVRMGDMTRFRRQDIEKFIEEHAKRNGSH
jgi:excisionase family DNA binding protein